MFWHKELMFQIMNSATCMPASAWHCGAEVRHTFIFHLIKIYLPPQRSYKEPENGPWQAATHRSLLISSLSRRAMEQTQIHTFVFNTQIHRHE